MSDSAFVTEMKTLLTAMKSSITTQIGAAITALGLKSASTHEAGDFATSAQGAKADTALQTAPVTSVAGRTGVVTLANTDISGLGTASTHAATDFASAAQGAKADTALQPGGGLSIPLGTGLVRSEITNTNSFWAYTVLQLPLTANFIDDTGRHMATPYGNAQISGGKYVGDGTGDRVDLPNSSDWELGTSAFSFDVMVCAIDFLATREIFAYRNSGDNGNFYFLRVNTNGTLRFYSKVSGVVVTDITTIGVLTANTNQHIRVVRSDSGLVKIYIDGINNDAVTTNLANAYPVNSYPFIIGQGTNDDPLSSFNGYLYWFRMVKGKAVCSGDFTPPSMMFEAGNVIGQVISLTAAATVAIPTGGNTVDSEGRAVLAEILLALKNSGLMNTA